MKAEEDPYLYTTVSIIPTPKKRKEKDFLGCIVFIGLLFAIISIQLACYTFKISALNFVKEVPIKKMGEIDAFMTKQHKAGLVHLNKLTDKLIPNAQNHVYARSCQSYISTVSAYKNRWQIDNLQEFLIFREVDAIKL